VPFARRMPWITMYVIQPTMMTQLIGFTLWSVGALEQPEQHQRDHLHGHDASEIHPKAVARLRSVRGAERFVGHGFKGLDDTAGRSAAFCLADNRLMNNRAAPGLPAGSSRKKTKVV